MKQLFAQVAMVTVTLEGVVVEYPKAVFQIYLDNHAPKYIKQILSKWEQGKNITDRDYYALIKKIYNRPYKARVLEQDCDLATLCGIELVNQQLAIREDAKYEVETKALGFCLQQILRPQIQEILNRYFPRLDLELNFWHQPVEDQLLDLRETLLLAYIFTLHNYLWHEEAQRRFGYFVSYFQTEFEKRVSFIKRLWENRRPGEALEYIPIFENFRNLNPAKGTFLIEAISRIWKNHDVLPHERRIIEEALIQHAKQVLNYRDQEAKAIRNTILQPMVSELVGMNKAKEFLHAAEVCFKYRLYDSTCNRCYYAVLRCIRSMLAKVGYLQHWRGQNLRPMETHEQIMNCFQTLLVEEKGIFSLADSEFLKKCFEERLIADYADSKINEGKAKNILIKTREFVEKAQTLLEINRTNVLD